MTRPSVYISYDPRANGMSALEFGCVDDGQPEERWEPVGDHVGLLHDAPGGRCVGFLVVGLADYDVDDPEHASLWDGPRFDAPVLGLTDVAPNAIVVASRALFGSTPTLNRGLFGAAIRAPEGEALGVWLRCLQSGDAMAHFGLGYTLYEQARFAESYRHLRHYCDLAPGEPWVWCWFGKAAAAVGETEEAERAFARAIDLEDPDEPTDAAELLEALSRGGIELPEPPAPDRDSPTKRAGDWLASILDVLPVAGELDRDGFEPIVLLDTDPVPVWLSCSPEGVASLRSLVGTVGEDEDAEEALAVILETQGEGDFWTRDDEVWLGHVLSYDFGAEVTWREVLIVATGLAAEARRVRLVYEDVAEVPLDRAPEYDDLEVEFDA